MRLLALDTATEACSVALLLDGAVHARFEIAGRSHTQRMLPMVHGLMAEAGVTFAQLDGLVCGVGPGSFAGVRIGVGFVKGLAMSLDLPVFGVSSLAMLAQGAIERGAQQVLCAIDARMDEVYFGAFEAHDGLARPVQDAVVARPDAVSTALAGPCAAVGSGWSSYESVLRAALGVNPETVDGGALPRAEQALRLALSAFERGEAHDAAALAPLYLRDKVALTLVEQQAARGKAGSNHG